MKMAIKEIRAASMQAVRDLADLKKKSKTERKHFDKEIKDAQKVIDAKKAEYEEAKHDKAAAGVAAALLREIQLAEKQKKSAEGINESLKETFKAMDKEIEEMKRLLRKISKAGRKMMQYERAVQRREKEFDKRRKRLEDAHGEIAKHMKKFEVGASPQTVVPALSADTRNFFAKLIAVLQADMEFDTHVKAIALENVIIAQQMQAFDKLNESLAESEKAVDTGGAAAVDLINAIHSSKKSGVNAKKVVAELKKAAAMIDYEEKIEKYMEQMAKRIEYQSAAVSSWIDKLAAMDNRTIATAEADDKKNAEHLGSAMATIVTRKEAIDKDYGEKADKFGEQLKKRNEMAAAAYKQAREAEGRLAA